MTTNTADAKEHSASALMRNVPISWKQGIEISNALRFHSVKYAKEYLQEVAALQRPVSFTRYWRDVGHKPGMAAGRYPQKAANYFLRLVKSAEANAQVKGLNTASLKIVKLITNRAPKAPSAGRRRHTARRSHLEIAVAEGAVRKSDDRKAKKMPLKVKTP